MTRPFGPPIDISKLTDFVSSHSPEDIPSEARRWSYDVADLLALADILYFHLKEADHSRVMYQYALDAVESGTLKASPDANLGGAYAILGKLLMLSERIEEALQSYLKAKDLGARDPGVECRIGVLYALSGDPREAADYLDRVFENSVGVLDRYLSPEELKYAAAVHERVRRGPATGSAATRKMDWWFASDDAPLPEGLQGLSISDLAGEADSRQLQSLRSAVVLLVSADRKVWYVDLFSTNDPRPLVEAGTRGDLRIQFYVEPQSGRLRGLEVMP